MKKHLFPRILSLILVVAMVASFAVPVHAATNSGISWRESDREVSLDGSDRLAEINVEEPAHKPTDMVRVSIVLEDKPTVQAGFSTMGIAQNAEAMAYSADLQTKQETMAKTISTQALGGKKLDVVWNLTLVGNVISANVPYGKIGAIEAIDGVRGVVLERTYEPCVVSREETATPQMYTSAQMIGSNLVWSSGYTGAGSRIAIIDTGTDTDHQSFDNGAYLYALQQNAAKAEMTEEAYIASLDLLDQAEIASVLQSLNAYERNSTLTAEDLYLNEKLAFGYNYKDNSLYITHDLDMQSEHGSHVAGISAANRYIPRDGGYVDALENVFVAGVAPDAQILTMKIFGISGGTTDADYMAAIEDAILLGCDSVNLSIGTTNAGEPYYDYYAELLNYMTTTDTVVVASAGNAGRWADYTMFQNPYSDDMVFDTHGAPGSFTSLFSVASVENAGSVGYGFKVNDLTVMYNEILGYGNASMTTLDTSADLTGTEYDYVFIDGLGYAADYEGIDLTGKVVICSRGTLNYADKANNAISRGAVALIVYNNDAGIVNMNLSGYQYSAPAVSILQSEGAAIRARSTEQTTDDGLTYFTGKMTVSGKMTAGMSTSEYYTMSSFSSWGVPSNLSLKPEITAPGGMIYSVYGSTPYGGGSDQYEIMSGTSMAAPQIAGMVALVAQYIREQGLDAELEISARHLAQSLLMSTAEPLFEEASGGNYYSLLNQGAGLGRVDLATSAETYILVDGQPDGKVKAELGDDPQRTGVYEFSFSINNMTGEAQDYALNADVFTQDVFDPGEQYGQPYGFYVLDTWTTDLPAVASFSSEGTAIIQKEDLAAHDVNGDGAVDALDADYLLEYLLGNETELKGEGDLNGDGTVSSYDAHLLLTLLDGNTCVTVPANGSVTVNVTLTLTQDAVEYLNTWNPDGAYVQSFVYANAIADEEGTIGTSHSIPVLAFYGNWTDPNMFDRGTWVEMANNVSDMVPYLYQVHGNGNFLTVDYGDGGEYYFGGNPILADETFLPERNAFNNATDDVLVGQYFTLIRNAEETRLILTNLDTGEVYFDEEMGGSYAAYYDSQAYSWFYTQDSILLDWDGSDPEGNPLPEGTTVELTLIAAPSYYRNADGTYDFDALGKGAYMSTPITIDNTAPTASNIALDLLSGTTLSVTAQDNQYVAAVALLNGQGTSVLASASPNQTEPNVEVTVDVDISEVSGKNFMVAVYDYANNVTTYEVELGTQEVERPYFTVIDYSSGAYYGVEADGSYVELATGGRGLMMAAEYVEGYVFEISDGNQLYVGKDEDLTNFRYLNTLDPNNEYGITNFLDLAYNYADGKLYGLFYADINAEMFPYLCTINMFTGVMDVLTVLPVDVNNMAIDGEGNFYSVAYYAPELYTYTVESVTAAEPSMTYVGSTGYWMTDQFNTLAWDHNTDKLYWGLSNCLLEVNPETAEVTLLSYYYLVMVGMYIRPGAGPGMFDPTDEVLEVTLDYTEARTLVGHDVLLEAQVWPWTVTDGSVSWSTSDETVATVSETGMVTGVSVGTAVITATSTLDPTKSASCTVKVETLEKTLNGIVWDAEGQVWWSEFDVNNPANYTKLTEEPSDVGLASTALLNGTLYATSVETGSGSLRSKLYTVDPETFEATLIGASTDGYSDIAPAPHLRDGSLAATYGGNFLVVDTSTGDYYAGEGDIFQMFAYNVVGIAYAGSQRYQEWGYDTTVDWYFLIDSEGFIYMLGWLEQDGRLYYLEHPSTTDGIFTVVRAQSDMYYFSSLYYDGEFLYYSCFNNKKDVSTLYAIDTNYSRKAYELGNFGTGVWPMGGLMELSDITTDSALLDMEITAMPKPVEEATTMHNVGTASKTSANTPNSISVHDVMEAPVAAPQSTGNYDAEAKQITVQVTAPDVSTNGRMTIGFDAKALTLKSVTGTTEAFAYTTGEGTVEIAFAAKTALAKDGAVATLIFDLAEVTTEELELTVNYSEFNDAASELTETIAVTLPHNYEAVVTDPTCTEGGYTTYTCTICGDSYVDDETVALGHAWGEWTAVEETTCTEDGIETRTCAVCGETETREVEASGHNYEIEVIEATCETAGYTLHTCSVCDDSYITDIVEATDHNFGEWTVVTPATCTEKGEESRSCECGETEIRTIDALGHTYESEVIEATCTTVGYTEHTCSVCDDSYITDIVEATGHTFGDWTVVTAPTCTEKGEESRSCECGKTETRTINALGHDYEAAVTAPTCEAKGYTTYTCSVCGDSYIDDQVDALGHDWSEWTVIAEVTCFDNGIETRTCAVCGETETRAIERNSDNCPSKAFEDVRTSEWYHEAVDFVIRNGLMKGMTDTTFVPNGKLTRAQLVTILYRLSGEPSVEGLEHPFEDVPANAWYTDAVIWAVNNGVVKGKSATIFDPNDAITREQIATILFRYTGSEKVEENYLADYTDGDKVSTYAVEAMNWAVANGLIISTSTSAAVLSPKDNATRAQIAMILMRYCETFAE